MVKNLICFAKNNEAPRATTLSQNYHEKEFIKSFRKVKNLFVCCKVKPRLVT